MSNNRVHVKDFGADHVLEEMSKKAIVKVGVFGEDAEKSHRQGQGTVGHIASIHEHGVGVPRRSFIRDTIDENSVEIARRVVKMTQAVIINRVTLAEALDVFGLSIQGDIQQRMADGIPPELDERTKARKRDPNSKPLIDTGQLRSSVSYEVSVDDSGPERPSRSPRRRV